MPAGPSITCLHTHAGAHRTLTTVPRGRCACYPYVTEGDTEVQRDGHAQGHSASCWGQVFRHVILLPGGPTVSTSREGSARTRTAHRGPFPGSEAR